MITIVESNQPNKINEEAKSRPFLDWKLLKTNFASVKSENAIVLFIFILKQHFIFNCTLAKRKNTNEELT